MDYYALTTYLTVMAAVIGLFMGSFLTCAASRQMHHQNWVTGRSECDFCGHELGAADLVPIFSWLFSGAKCRHCKHKLPASYPLSEILCAVGYASIVWTYGLNLQTVEGLIIFSLLYAVAVCDWQAYTIPNGLVVSIIAVRVAFCVAYAVLGIANDWLQGICCGVGVALVVLLLSLAIGKLKGVNAMGGGDIKLLFAVGLCLTLPQTLIMVFVSCILGIILGLVPREGAAKSEADLEALDARLAGEAAPQQEAAPGAVAGEAGEAGEAPQEEPTQEEEGPASAGQLIPFGTAIAVGYWFCITVALPLLQWYLALL